MSLFLGLVGFAGVIVFVIMAGVALFKKKGNAKRYFMYAGISFVLFVLGLSVQDTEEPVPVATEVIEEEPKAETEENEKKAEEEAKAAEEKAAAEKAKEEKAKAEAEKKAAEEMKQAEAEQAKKDAAEKAEAEKALDAEGISKEEFAQIENGMTYEEVVAIIGVEGEILSEVGEKGTQFYTIMYMWDGETGLGANANAMFQGNKLNAKSQFGLE
ncbi:hypothetical protein AB1K32_15255 [Metabacillus dongyingensis]|uniref:hypothetical protein n=1 Tax=Metabacillus dongyingensis TaxID=2874282 RepID=UPI003B8BBF08